MATLNNEEQAKHDRVAALEAARRNRTAFVSDGELNEARQLAEYATNNAEARERFEAQRDAEAKAQQDGVQARRDAEVTAAQDAYKRLARVTFPGTDAQFADAWPALLQAWLIRNTAPDMDALIAQKRAMLADVL